MITKALVSARRAEKTGPNVNREMMATTGRTLVDRLPTSVQEGIIPDACTKIVQPLKTDGICMPIHKSVEANTFPSGQQRRSAVQRFRFANSRRAIQQDYQ